jgi:hypothetical protein
MTAGASVNRQTAPKLSASTPQEMNRSRRPVAVRRAAAGGVALMTMSAASASAMGTAGVLDAAGRRLRGGVRLLIRRRV